MNKGDLKKSSYVLFANAFSVSISVGITFIIPLLFSPESYGYYQLENLYCGYLWILSIGWHEGIYLIYGGERKETIDNRMIATQFWYYTVFMIIIMVGTYALTGIWLHDSKKKFVLVIAMVSIVIEAIRYIFLYYLISINDMTEYAKYLLLDRVIYIGLIIILVSMHQTDYKFLLGSDILSKMIVLVVIIAINHQILLQRLYLGRTALAQSVNLIKSGISVTFAVFVGRFINGTVRLAIESVWGLLAFGRISLTLSISNMFTQLVQAVGVVLFPTLRNARKNSQIGAYKIISVFLDAIMLTVFLFYLPAERVLCVILPQYADGLKYMAILLPICLYDARNTILNNTYLKALHKEKGILIGNIIAVLCSFLLTIISVYICKNIDYAVLSLVVLSAIKCIVLEVILGKCFEIPLLSMIVKEIVMVVIFIYTSWQISGIKGLSLYFVALVIYLVSIREQLKLGINYIRKIS